MILRIALGLFGALFVSVSIFWVLQSLISINQKEMKQQDNIRFIDFVRLERDNELQKKQRVKPKKPKPLPKPKPKTQVKQQKMDKKKMTTEPMKLDLDMPLDLAAKGMLGDAMVSGGFGSQEVNTNVMPLSKVNPVYPRRAKMMKIEGYAQAEFTITKSGNVKDVVIVKSYPEGIFDNSVKKALLRWTFKPKMDEGKAYEQRAGVTLNFRLDK